MRSRAGAAATVYAVKRFGRLTETRRRLGGGGGGCDYIMVMVMVIIITVVRGNI